MRILPVAVVTFGLAYATALAQDLIALSVEGWRQESRSDGVTYYRCASSICAAGSVVSYKAQPHRTTITLADFENHHHALAQHNTGSRNIRAVRVLRPRERTLQGVRVMQISREVDWADNTTTFTLEARLIGPDRSFSLVSDSPGREWTNNNFEGFLARMVDIAGVRTP